MDDDGASNTISKNITVIKPSPDYIVITFSTKNEIHDCNVSTNFSFIAYSSAFNYTYGFIGFINANWSILNYGSNASINASYGKCVKFNSGINDGLAILQAEYNGCNDTIVFTINSSIFSFSFHKGWNLVTILVEINLTAKSLLENITGCNIVYAWDSLNQTYKVYTSASPDEYNFVIKQGEGVFVGVSEESIWHGEG